MAVAAASRAPEAALPQDRVDAAEGSTERTGVSEYLSTLILTAWQTGAAEAEQTSTRAFNMIGASIVFGLSLMLAVVMMIVTGLFLVTAPTSGAFSSQLGTAETIGGAGFVILIVVMLFIPIVGLIGYIFNSGLGAFISGAGGLGR